MKQIAIVSAVVVAVPLLTPFVYAAGIYQRAESAEAVELSNVPTDEDYDLLLAAPPAANAPATVAPAASSSDGMRVRPAAVGRADPGASADDSPRLATMESTSAAAGTANEPSPAVQAGAPVSGYGGGAVPVVSSPAATPSAKVSGPDAAGATAAASQTANAAAPSAATTPVATSSPGSILDSPEALAARLAQYRSLMLNEAVQANGMPANPAVVRRYLMVNRATYMSQ
jgi:hypothetical protein